MILLQLRNAHISWQHTYIILSLYISCTHTKQDVPKFHQSPCNPVKSPNQYYIFLHVRFSPGHIFHLVFWGVDDWWWVCHCPVGCFVGRTGWLRRLALLREVQEGRRCSFWWGVRSCFVVVLNCAYGRAADRHHDLICTFVLCVLCLCVAFCSDDKYFPSGVEQLFGGPSPL